MTTTPPPHFGTLFVLMAQTAEHSYGDKMLDGLFVFFKNWWLWLLKHKSSSPKLLHMLDVVLTMEGFIVQPRLESWVLLPTQIKTRLPMSIRVCCSGSRSCSFWSSYLCSSWYSNNSSSCTLLMSAMLLSCFSFTSSALASTHIWASLPQCLSSLVWDTVNKTVQHVSNHLKMWYLQKNCLSISFQHTAARRQRPTSPPPWLYPTNRPGCNRALQPSQSHQPCFHLT